ncbi:MAG: prepilin-type N-terminal cleavage/methylation domain-containing protein [Acidobacteriota bacterium]|nr:prepilin-type N-terminal cleavage/methylation domain-containing protein [Acidobacteriota bacterium]
MLASSRGFTLIEVLVATAVFVTAVLALAQLVGFATRSDRVAHGLTLAGALAAERLEQLESVAGSAARASPPGTLDRDTPGFVDYFDDQGRWVGGGPALPVGARFVRRWAVTRLSTDPPNLLRLEAVVLPVRSHDATTATYIWAHVAGVRVGTWD